MFTSLFSPTHGNCAQYLKNVFKARTADYNRKWKKAANVLTESFTQKKKNR